MESMNFGKRGGEEGRKRVIERGIRSQRGPYVYTDTSVAFVYALYLIHWLQYLSFFLSLTDYLKYMR